MCAHGAGGHKDDRGMLRLAATLAPRGFEVVRFNFPYREKGSRRPDAMPTLKSCISEIAARSRKAGASLYIGGLPGWTMHWLEGADHSFHVLKSSGRSDSELYEEVGEASLRWHNQLPREEPNENRH